MTPASSSSARPSEMVPSTLAPGNARCKAPDGAAEPGRGGSMAFDTAFKGGTRKTWPGSAPAIVVAECDVSVRETLAAVG